VTLSDIAIPESYVISGKGNGGVAGFAKGGARVHLEEVGPQETKLTYQVEAAVGGKLAQLGQRLIKSTSEKLALQFFDSFARQFDEPSP
jgi:carbon monoxide dehydrogenase subunit G